MLKFEKFLFFWLFLAIPLIYYLMEKTFWQDVEHIFFIGIGGISMSGLAAYLIGKGFSVSGSDIAENGRIARLRASGARIFIGHRSENIGEAQIVVCSSAIKQNNPERLAALAKGLPVIGRADLLSAIASDYKNVVAVAGCHGKTTATAMCAHAIENCAGGVTAHIGGEDSEYGNMYVGGERFFVTEACEYMANFLKLRPSAAVVLNTDADHLDFYGNAQNLTLAYCEFCEKSGASIVCREDKIAELIRPELTFGLSPKSDVCAEDVVGLNGKYAFTLRAYGEMLDKVRLNVYGKHNVYNALAAAAVCLHYRFPPYLIAEGLEKFKGIRRRFEQIGRYAGARFIADYAHHPSEIAAALQTAHEIARGKLIVVFQPHTYSRTKAFFDAFVNVLSGVENLVIYKTYPAREYFDEAGCALTLAEHLDSAIYIETVKELVLYLRGTVSAGGTVLVLGAGDIYYAAKEALARLNGNDQKMR